MTGLQHFEKEQKSNPQFHVSLQFHNSLGIISGSTRRKMGIISGSGSFRGQFGDHFRVGDHFAVGIISGAVQMTFGRLDRKANVIVRKRRIIIFFYTPTLHENHKNHELTSLNSTRDLYSPRNDSQPLNDPYDRPDRPDRPSRLKKSSDDRDDYMETLPRRSQTTRTTQTTSIAWIELGSVPPGWR